MEMDKILSPKGMNKCIGCLTCMNACAVANHNDHSLIKSAVKVRTVGGMTSSFIAVVCRGCDEPACMEVCPADALTLRPGGGVLLDEEKCFGCRRCRPACSLGAVFFDEDTQKPIICKHCGICTTFCPHDCLMMVDAEEVFNHAK